MFSYRERMNFATCALYGPRDHGAKDIDPAGLWMASGGALCDRRGHVGVAWRRPRTRPYHVLARRLIVGAFALSLASGCARAPAAGAYTLEAMAHAKARPDLLAEETRSLVLLAAWASLVGDEERASRWYQRALCLDPRSEFLRARVDASRADGEDAGASSVGPLCLPPRPR